MTQTEHCPDQTTREAAGMPLHALNVAATFTGHGYPISGDTIADIKDAHPKKETP